MLGGRIVFYCGYYRKAESFQAMNMVAGSNSKTHTEKFVLNGVTCPVLVSASVLMMYVVSSELAASHLLCYYLYFLFWGRGV